MTCLNKVAAFLTVIISTVLLISPGCLGIGAQTAEDEPEMTTVAEATPEQEPEFPQMIEQPTDRASFSTHNSAETELLSQRIMSEPSSLKNSDFEVLEGKHNDLFFGLGADLNGGYLAAYNTAVRTYRSDPEGASYELEYFFLADELKRYPLELGIEARDRIVEYMAKYLGMGVDGVWEPELYPYVCGFCGDDYVVFTGYSLDSPHTKRLHVIYRSDDGENWYEFGGCNDSYYQPSVTGARILSDKVGYLSLYSLSYNDGRDFRVVRTEDGGQSWQELDLTIPEEYYGYGRSGAMSPYFNGDNGVIIIWLEYYEEDNAQYIGRRYCWFITHDGGDTWSFGAPEG